MSAISRVCLAAALVHYLTQVVPSALASYADVQYLGLESLYNTTAGQEWTRSSGWRDSELGVCNWYGVMCDGDSGNVTGLALSDNGLAGEVSQAIDLSNVTSLEDVDLSHNLLSGPVPLSFGLMPKLEVLELSGNELSSFPDTWGSGASALRYLSVQDNIISGSLPTAWLEVNDSSVYPLVHFSSVSLWLPELRSLLLGGNELNSTGYATLQALVSWKSLQVCDLSGNALTGSLEEALTLYICDGLGRIGCATRVSTIGAPLLRVLKLDGNSLAGQLPQIIDTEERRVEVLDISDNSEVNGTVPQSYSELLMLFANGTGLSGANLPSFIDAAGGSPQYESTHNMLVCPTFQPSTKEDAIAITLDPSYDDYSLCTCDDGYGGSSGSCSECPIGWFRGMEEDGDLADGCLACPSNSTTLQEGRWLKSQCVCSANFYDELGGLRDSGPSCVECPFQSRTLTPGATNVTSCECGPGYILGNTSECEPCVAGTYKPAYGNQAELCLPCHPGSYSSTVGATLLTACEACPLGFYGDSYGTSSLGGCTACPAGTYGTVEGLPSEVMCTRCWAGFYSPALGAKSSSTCIMCPSNHSQPIAGAGSLFDCTPCSEDEVADEGSSQCSSELLEDGTLIGLYLLIAGIILVIFTLVWVYAQKHCGSEVPVTEKVHMKLNDEMKVFIYAQQFWISLFSGVEIMDLMSDLGAYASLLYTAALTGAMKIVYTIVVAFALTASLHGVHTRAIIILDMQEERAEGLAITGNNMLYYEKQYSILQIMAQKRTCRRHVPFDRGNKYLCHHIGVQRLISLNSMRIIIAIFEDIPFLVLNMFLLLQQPDLAKNHVFMISFVLSIFVLGYKMTLLEKHARLQIRKWNLEARMDTDTMLNKKAARGRRFSWACEQCQVEGITPDDQKALTKSLFPLTGEASGSANPRSTTPSTPPARRHQAGSKKLQTRAEPEGDAAGESNRKAGPQGSGRGRVGKERRGQGRFRFGKKKVLPFESNEGIEDALLVADKPSSTMSRGGDGFRPTEGGGSGPEAR